MSETSNMPWRAVEPREGNYPHLSIVYRVWAQQEIWVLHDGKLREYFNAFQEDLQIPELSQRGKNTQFVETEDAVSLANKLLDEVPWGGDTRLDTDPRYHMPYLTQLYRAIVLNTDALQFNDEQRTEIEHHLVAEMLGIKLFW